jgi:membrane-associated HD superfamily phosphohydrolase
MELNKVNKLYNQITIKSGILLLILFLIFIVVFSETKLTIIAATNLSNILLVVLLTINQIIFFYSLSNSNSNHNYKIYIILLSILMTIMLVYTLYIKRIYDEEHKIINQLKEKDILADTNIRC